MEDWHPMKCKAVKEAEVVGIVVVVVVVVICTSKMLVVGVRSELVAILLVDLTAAVMVGVNIFQDRCNTH